jgi:hypothetical protein
MEGTMATGLPFLRRIAALSAAIALIGTSAAAAQTPTPPSAGDAPANSALLSPAAFARLVGAPGAGEVRTPFAPDPLSGERLRQSIAARTQQAAALSPQPPRQGSRHNVKGFVIGTVMVVGVLGGLLAASYYTGVDFMPLADAIFGR